MTKKPSELDKETFTVTDKIYLHNKLEPPCQMCEQARLVCRELIEKPKGTEGE